MALPACFFPIQIINGDGVFNVTGLNRLVKEAKLEECGVSYTVVSIMGPQSSGKSTLLNHLFHTNFKEMDFNDGKSQTTKGIWMARAVEIKPCTLVMDLEGSDGRERGDDDTNFERQSAVFALAISDIVLINMWCNDIGRVQAANTPLLRTVFQVMARIFTPRRTTLMFVIRDKSRSPFEKLEAILRKDIHKIWDSVSKSEANQGAALSDFFDVQVVALPSFEANKEGFDEEVASLRQRVSHSIANGRIVWDRHGVVHASGFSINAQQIWQHIKENKDIDLPSLTVMVSTIRCEEIAQEKFRSFLQNKDWRRLEESARSGPEPHFGRQLTSILNDCLSGYREEALPFNKRVRISNEKQLEEKLLEHAQPAFRSVVGHLRSRALGRFKQDFHKALRQGEGFASSASFFQKVIARFDEECADATVKQAKWNASKEKGELKHDMHAHIDSLKAENLSKLISTYEAKLNDALAGPVEDLLGNANNETWTSIRDLIRRKTGLAVSDFTSAIQDLEIDEENKRKILDKLQDHSTGVVETKAKEVARNVLILMKERFMTLSFPDNESMRRILTGEEDIRTIILAARSASLKLLAVMAAVRLDHKADNIEKMLSLALLDNPSADSLVSENWEGVPLSRTLITPVQCDLLWRQFIQETKCVVSQSFSIQVKVSATLSEDTSKRKFVSFSKDEDWLKLEKAARKGRVPDFGTKISSMIHDCLSRYEIETKNSDKVARISNQVQLKEKLLHLVRPSYQYILGLMRCDTLYDFQESFDKALQSGEGLSSAASHYTRHYMALFDKACIGAFIELTDWDASICSEDLRRDMDAHVSFVQACNVYELEKECEGKLNDALPGTVETLVDGGNDETLSSKRKLLRCETDSPVSDFHNVQSYFKMVEKAREAAKQVSSIKDRFSGVLSPDKNSMRRILTGKGDLVDITLSNDEEWLNLKKAARKGRVPDFGTQISSMIHDYLSRYEIETNNSDRVARMSSQMLKEKLLHRVRPSYQYILGHMMCDTLYDFQKAFDKALESGKGFSSAASDCTRHYMAIFGKACVGTFIEQTDWDASICLEDLQRDMDAHVSFVQVRKVNELVKECEGKLNDALAGSVETILDGANEETWSSIRNLLLRETDSTISYFCNALSHFEMDDQKEKMIDNLRDHAVGVVEEKAREGAKMVSGLMKDRFSRLFFFDNNSMMLRVWTGKEDLEDITTAARFSSLKVLSVMAAVRLDDKADNIEGTLSAVLSYDHSTYRTSDGSESRFGSLASDSWDEIPRKRTLVSPAQCEALWKQFIQETESLVARATPKHC